MAQQIELRAYQTRTIDDARALVRQGRRRVLVVAPTGAGKTTIAGAIAAGHVQNAAEPRVVWMAHRAELLRQAADRMRDFGLRVEYNGESVGAPVYVTSVQSLLASREAPDASLVVFDEAHHYVSDEWMQVARAYVDAPNKPIILGLSATPEREDGTGLRAIFDGIVVAAQVRELMDLNVREPTQGLVEPEVVHPPAGSLGKNELARHPVDAYRELAGGRSTVVFAPNVPAAEKYAEDFRAAGIPAACIHGKLSTDEREARLAAFAAGDLAVLTNVAILTEGWDCPRTKCVMFARKVGSLPLYIQMVGRALRPWHPSWVGLGGPRSAASVVPLVVDLADVVNAHGPVDEPLEYSLTGRAVRRAGTPEGARFCRSCGLIVEGEACPGCLRTGGRDLILPRDAHLELRKFQRDAWARTLSTDARVRMLAKWYGECDAAGHKRKSAHYKYKALHHRWPDKAMVQQAERVLAQVRERESVQGG